jgi:phosphohistidine swiveling domain-containing protein
MPSARLWTTSSPAYRAHLARQAGRPPERWRFEAFLEQFCYLPEGDPYTFGDHQQLREIARALEGRKVVLQKSAQEGATTLIQLNIFWLSFKFTLGIGYFLPTDVWVGRASKTKVADTYRENAHLGLIGEEKDEGSVSVRPLGNTYMYLLGTKVIGNLKTIPMDCIVPDEVDDIEPASLRLARERMEHSKWKYERHLSVPSFPNYGINAEFNASDQRKWIVRCRACRNEFSPEETWPDCVLDRAEPVTCCPKCKKPTAFWIHGRWVKQAESDTAGFRLSRLNSARLTTGSLRTALKEWKAGIHRAILVNNLLAMEYLDADAKLDAEWILANRCGQGGLTGGADVIGLDVGVPFYACGITGEARSHGVTILEQLIGWSEVYRMAQRTPESTRIIVDAAPETNAAREFQQAFPGRVVLCRYTDQKERYKWDEAEGVVNVNRTESLDASHAAIVKGHMTLPRKNPEVELWAKHASNIARKVEENPDTGKRRAVWKKTGADHYRHAYNYAVIGLSQELPGEIEQYAGGLV